MMNRPVPRAATHLPACLLAVAAIATSVIAQQNRPAPPQTVEPDLASRILQDKRMDDVVRMGHALLKSGMHAGVELDASSHRAIDIYDNALWLVAVGEYLETVCAGDAARREKWTVHRDSLRKSVRERLWDEASGKFIPHLYLEGSPFPDDFDENRIFYHGGTAVAIEAGLLNRDEIAASHKTMRENMAHAGAATVGLTLYPPYPEGLFKNRAMRPYSYQNGGDWTWFGARMVRQLARNGYVEEAYQELVPMLERVLKHQGFFEWWTPGNDPKGSGKFRGSAGVLIEAIDELRTWAKDPSQSASHAVHADVKISKTGDSVIDARALTIQGGFGQAINGLAFQQNALMTHGSYQYVGYYDSERQVCLARRILPNGNWESLRFEDYDFKSNDSHNTISIGICPKDGTLHLAFDHHGHPLHYRVSQKGIVTEPYAVAWDASSFGPITSEIEKDKPIRITYPRFWQTPDGGLQFCYRRGGSGNGDRMLVDYDAERGVWRNTRPIDSGRGLFIDAMGASSSRCSYPNGYDYGPHRKLHATWVWREHSQGANHDLVYVYSEDLGHTWMNSAGNKLEQPPGIHSPGVTVVDIPRTLGLMNTHGQAVDSQGRIHVVMWHCSEASLVAAGSTPGEHRWGPPEARRNHHYRRDQKGNWHHHELPGTAGTRAKIFLDQHDNAYVIYSDAWTRGLFSTEGRMIIMGATSKAGWRDWKVLHVEEGPFGNEMLIDPSRWKQNNTLSVLVQEAPAKAHEPTTLRILDFSIGKGD